MEEVSAKMGTGDMPREQWEHEDKEVEDERKGEHAMVHIPRETVSNIHEGRRREECSQDKNSSNMKKNLYVYIN